MTTQQIEEIKFAASSLSGDSKAKYLQGVRDGLDLAVLIAGDNNYPLAENVALQEFLDYLGLEG